MVYYYAAAALLGLAASVNAVPNVHHNHAALHKKGAPEPYGAKVKYVTPVPMASAAPNATSCGCTTYTTTWYGPAMLGPGPTPATNSSTSTTSYPTANVPSIPVTTYSVSTTETPVPTSYSSPPASSSSPVPTSYSSPPASSSSPVPETPVSPVIPSAPVSYGGSDKSSTGGGVDVNKDGSGDSAYGVSSITPNGNQWAMTYTPYANDGTCKSAGTVMGDIASIKAKGFTTVRIYATDCSGLVNVGAACKASGMKLIVGIYIDGSGLGKAKEQVGEITSWGKSGNWNLVEMVVAGNEAVFNGFVSASALAGFISSTKGALKAAGYSGPVTTTEPLNIMQANAGTLCPAMDVAAANIHPYFNGGFSASQAGDFVASQLSDLEKACPNKPAYILETGWPSSGQPNNVAVPGTAEQKTAIDGIMSKVGSKAAIFSFTDDPWKAPGQYNVEQYFGCSQLFSS